MIRTREFTTYTAADGSVYQLHVPAAIGRWVISDSGYGLPPIEYITERAPAQHGETMVNYFLRPRIIQLLIRQQFCNREDYWSGRAALLDAIRPNRQLTPNGTMPGVLTKTLPTGDQRSLAVFITEGPRFEPRQVGQWDEFAFQEVLRFVAYDPVAYDPDSTSTVFAASQEELIFPITFPIIFSSFELSTTLVYTGTWLELPIITITGPGTSFSITNDTTGEVLAIVSSLGVGETIIIDLRDGYKTVTQGGVNIIGRVTPESALATWHLAPDPEAPGGNNLIVVAATGADSDTAVEITWFNRYIGF